MPGRESLEDRSVLIIGSGPMGVSTAVCALAAGCRVTLVGRDADRVRSAGDAVTEGASTLQGVRRTGPDLTTRTVDVDDPDELDELWSALVPDHTAVLAGNPHASSSYGIASSTLAGAQQDFARFWLSFAVLQLAAAGQRSPGSGGRDASVTLLSGSSSRRPSDGRGYWGTLHGAIEALGRNAAWELAPLRVNVVSPGGINVTPPNRPLVPGAGSPGDIADAVLMLMANRTMTGALLDVDAGEFLGASPQTESQD